MVLVGKTTVNDHQNNLVIKKQKQKTNPLIPGPHFRSTELEPLEWGLGLESVFDKTLGYSNNQMGITALEYDCLRTQDNGTFAPSSNSVFTLYLSFDREEKKR